MPPFFIKSITLVAFFVFSTSLYSQQKYEKESRLKPEEVPQAALEFIQAIEIPNKVKWYIEYGLENNSIEAKFKLNKKRHSVEFDTLGTIEDVEIEIKLRELDPKLKKTIDAVLSHMCSDHEISKIQKQYTGAPSVLLSLLKGQELTGKFTTKYEVVATCESESKTDQFEYLFSDEGKLLQQFKIIFKNSSNLEY